VQYLSQYRVNHTVYYTVYNSLGELALVTSSYALAQSIALSFERNPTTIQIKVRDLDPNRVKRR
jgi:hypothetical protein